MVSIVKKGWGQNPISQRAILLMIFMATIRFGILTSSRTHPPGGGGGGRKGGKGDVRYLIFGCTELIQPLIGAGERRGVDPA